MTDLTSRGTAVSVVVVDGYLWVVVTRPGGIEEWTMMGATHD